VLRRTAGVGHPAPRRNGNGKEDSRQNHRSGKGKAHYAQAIPIRPGKPLRERFQESELFCFGRDYDAAHLAKHPQQKVASIRVGRLNPEAERRNSYQKWPDDVK
jgi:hypothetical protein